MNDKTHQTVVNAIYLQLQQIASRRRRVAATGYGEEVMWDGVDQRDTEEMELGVKATPLDRQRAAMAEHAGLAGMTKEIMEVPGTPPGTKSDGVCQILYENANGIDCRKMHHPKVVKARRIHDMLGADIVAYNKHRLNLCQGDNRIGFNQLFYCGEADLQSVVVHNTHENTLRGKNGFVTRIVCRYNPCGNVKRHSGMVYQQHRQFLLTQCKLLTCPRVQFQEDLVGLLTEWQEQGDCLIVCLDANEDIYKKSLGKTLMARDGLAMKEVVGEFTGRRLGATHFRVNDE